MRFIMTDGCVCAVDEQDEIRCLNFVENYIFVFCKDMIHQFNDEFVLHQSKRNNYM